MHGEASGPNLIPLTSHPASIIRSGDLSDQVGVAYYILPGTTILLSSFNAPLRDFYVRHIECCSDCRMPIEVVSHIMKSSACLNDDSFGPVVEGCRDDFDFTIRFELIFFSLIPTSIFIVLAAVRIGYLSPRSRIVGSVAFQVLKLVSPQSFCVRRLAVTCNPFLILLSRLLSSPTLRSN